MSRCVMLRSAARVQGGRVLLLRFATTPSWYEACLREARGVRAPACPLPAPTLCMMRGVLWFLMLRRYGRVAGHHCADGVHLRRRTVPFAATPCTTPALSTRHME